MLRVLLLFGHALSPYICTSTGAVRAYLAAAALAAAIAIVNSTLIFLDRMSHLPLCVPMYACTAVRTFAPLPPCPVPRHGIQHARASCVGEALDPQLSIVCYSSVA